MRLRTRATLGLVAAAAVCGTAASHILREEDGGAPQNVHVKWHRHNSHAISETDCTTTQTVTVSATDCTTTRTVTVPGGRPSSKPCTTGTMPSSKPKPTPTGGAGMSSSHHCGCVGGGWPPTASNGYPAPAGTGGLPTVPCTGGHPTDVGGADAGGDAGDKGATDNDNTGTDQPSENSESSSESLVGHDPMRDGSSSAASGLGHGWLPSALAAAAIVIVGVGGWF